MEAQTEGKKKKLDKITKFINLWLDAEESHLAQDVPQ